MELASSPSAAPKQDRDPRASLQNLLSDPSPPPQSPKPDNSSIALALAPVSTQAPLQPQQPPISSQDAPPIATEESPTENASAPASNDVAMTTTTRRNAGGTVSSVYSGNRIKYLKKEDGIPFWRKDIQYTFLKMVFEDDKRVFTRFSDQEPGHTFAEVYIDSMANSSKCSQILKDKLLSDRWEELGRPEPVAPNGHSPAIDMAMVCLLVNVGRMNTTINFFPEMRARVRTFHSIPCLQARAGPMAYKQLQDGPRLKSILKGALEDVSQPATVPAMYEAVRPRTNPVSLVFLFANYAPKISELHFPPSRDFFDIFMRETLTSRSRATAFLSLMWWYMESDLSAEDVQNNPYGAGVSDDPEKPFRIPPLDMLTEEEAAKENEDPEEEIEFGERKRLEREVILAIDDPVQVGGKRGKGVKDPSSRQAHASQAELDSSRIDDSFQDGRRSPDLLPRLVPAHASSSLYPPRSEDEGSSPPRGGRRSHLLRGESDKSQEMASRREPGDRDGASAQPRGKRLLPSLKSSRGQSGHSDPSQMPSYEYRPRPALAPAGGNQQSYSNTGSPYESRRVLPSNGAADEQVAPPPSGRSSKRGAARDPQRFEEMLQVVEQNLRTIRKARRREKRRRGVIADAWIKAQATPDGYDSEVDDRGRMAGFHDIRQIEWSSLALQVQENTEVRRLDWNCIDGDPYRVEIMAETFRRLGKRFKRMDTAQMASDADSARLPREGAVRVGEDRSRAAATATRQDIEGFHWQQQQQPGSSTLEAKRHVSTFPLPPAAEHTRSPARAFSQPSGLLHTTLASGLQPFNQTPATSTASSMQELPPSESRQAATLPRPVKQPRQQRRKRKQSSINGIEASLDGSVDKSPSQESTTSNRRPPTSSGASASNDKDKDKDSVFAWVPKGRKRKDSDVRGDILGTLRPGEMGVPTNVFFSDKKIAEQSVLGGSGNTGSVTTGSSVNASTSTPATRRARRSIRKDEVNEVAEVRPEDQSSAGTKHEVRKSAASVDAEPEDETKAEGKAAGEEITKEVDGDVSMTHEDEVEILEGKRDVDSHMHTAKQVEEDDEDNIVKVSSRSGTVKREMQQKEEEEEEDDVIMVEK